MSKYTFIVEFEDGEEPNVGLGTKILGGRLCMVALEDIRKYHFEEEEAQVLESFLEGSGTEFHEVCKKHGVSAEAIQEKIYQLSI